MKNFFKERMQKGKIISNQSKYNTILLKDFIKGTLLYWKVERREGNGAQQAATHVSYRICDLYYFILFICLSFHDFYMPGEYDNVLQL